MFKFGGKTRDVITLFHRPSVASSVRANTLLKQISAHTSETATGDQAGDHSSQDKVQRHDFELDVTESPPTSDQLRTLLGYMGDEKASKLVDGARDSADAVAKLKANAQSFRAPVIVDWSNGRAVIGDNESEILKLVAQLK